MLSLTPPRPTGHNAAMPEPSTSRPLDRLIRLRRPPRLVRVDDRFVPDVPLAAVDRCWARLCEANPRYFDGDILHVLGTSRDGHGGVTLHVAPTSYRFYAVQRPGLAGGLDCGVRPLGAKGLTVVGDRIAMARRSGQVAYYPSEWEFVPGGGVEAKDDPATCVQRELAEETTFEAVTPPVAVALLYDSGALTWEVVHRWRGRDRRGEAAGGDHAWEHGDRALVAAGAWPSPLCHVAKLMLPLAEEAVAWAKRSSG